VLNTAHAMGVVHRDLKPDNIMIGNSSNGEPVVKLLDLGIAKMREIAGGDGGGTALTMAGQILGTPHYMSPEQWGELPRDGDPEIDGRADIYSLGIVCYEMLVGKRPYSGKTLPELRREHISVVPPPVYETVPNVPRAFGDAITRATAKDRGDRFPTAGDFAAQLRAAANSTDSAIGFDRTMPDLPHIQDSQAHTGGVTAAVDTNSDVNAPTVLTLDSPLTAPVRQNETRPQGPNALGAAKFAPSTPAAVAEAPSIVTVQQPRPKVEVPLPSSAPPAKSKTGLILAAVGLIVLLLAGVGGFFAIRKLTGSTTTTGSTITENSNGTSDVPATVAQARYWLELLPEDLIGTPTRVAGLVPLASEQSFKFHFSFNEDGYVYIVGPGEQNKLTAFLTAKPPSLSGLTSNRVAKGEDFSFPEGIEHWLRLDKKAGTEDYTVVFSTKPLTVPAFFATQATGSPLSDTEQSELASFVSQHKTGDPVLEINDKDAAKPFTSVKAPRVSADAPLIFRVRIQHN
jgi:serine/threonine protein kinase